MPATRLWQVDATSGTTALGFIAVTAPSPVAVGDCIMVDLSVGGHYQLWTGGPLDDNLGNTYVPAFAAPASINDGSNDQDALIYRCIVTVAGTPTITARFATKIAPNANAVADFRYIGATAYRASTGYVFDFDVASVGALATTTTPNSGSLTSLGATGILHGTCVVTGNVNIAAPTAGAGFTSGIAEASGGGTMVAASEWKAITAGSQSAVFAFPNGAATITFATAFKEVATAPPTYDPWQVADGSGNWKTADGSDWITANSAATGVTDYTHVASGGLVGGGSSPSRQGRVTASSGGLVSGGAAPSKKGWSSIASGGLISGGAASSLRKRAVAGAGGLLSGGTAILVRAIRIVASGGLASGGAALSSRKRVAIASGGFLSGGAAPATLARSYSHVASGGLVSGGAATSSRKRATVSAGGLLSSGAALVSRAVRISGTGGLLSSGAAPSVRRRAVIAAGGLASGGAALLSRAVKIVGTGGLSSGGAATVSFGSGGHANYTHTMSGGLASGGAALVRISQFRVASGGLTSGGAAPTRRARATVGAGGLVSGGAATLRRQSSVVGSGGLLGGGAAFLSRRRASIASGGGTFGGTGLASRRYGWTGTGGLVSGGSALSRRALRIVGSGGLLAGGSAALRRRLAYVATGGLVSGGAAITLLDLAPTIGLPLTVIWGGRSTFTVYLEGLAERYKVWLEASPRYEVITDDSVSAVTLTLEDS
jgi:hypothetical protein